MYQTSPIKHTDIFSLVLKHSPFNKRRCGGPDTSAGGALNTSGLGGSVLQEVTSLVTSL